MLVSPLSLIRNRAEPLIGPPPRCTRPRLVPRSSAATVSMQCFAMIWRAVRKGHLLRMVSVVHRLGWFICWAGTTTVEHGVRTLSLRTFVPRLVQHPGTGTYLGTLFVDPTYLIITMCDLYSALA